VTATMVPAVVVGLCSHGLAVARALGRAGVPVHALEANPDLPGAATKYARFHRAHDINGPALIDDLAKLAASIASPRPPILFLTNDNMVRLVSAQWERLQRSYSLSWAGSRQTVDTLIMKETFRDYCNSIGARHPRTCVVRSVDDVGKVEGTLAYPMIVKPSKPLSVFKVKVVRFADELRDICKVYSSGLPFVVQDLIEGSDRQIAFCNMFLSDGAVVAHFEGRKLRAVPPCLGMATGVGYQRDNALFELSRDFFARTRFTGPAALEVKYDGQDRGWIIEATVGRTEYLVAVCIAGGVNLPYVEYCHQAGLPVPNTTAEPSIWADSERDLPSLARVPLWWFQTRGARVTLPFLSSDDMRPFARASLRMVHERVRRLVSRAKRLGVSNKEKVAT